MRRNRDRFAHPLPGSGLSRFAEGSTPKSVADGMGRVEVSDAYTMEPSVPPPMVGVSPNPPLVLPRLVQIRPHPSVGVSVEGYQQSVIPGASEVHPRCYRDSGWYRWFARYIPCLILVGMTLYILSELILKHLAFKNLQQHLVDLPETPPPLTLLGPVGAQPPVVNPVAAVAPLQTLSLPRSTSHTSDKILSRRWVMEANSFRSDLL